MATANEYEAALQAAERHGYHSLNAYQKNLVDRLVKESSSRGRRAKKVVGLK